MIMDQHSNRPQPAIESFIIRVWCECPLDQIKAEVQMSDD